MRIVVVQQPDPLVELEDVKTALGESGSDRDILIGGLILAGQAYLDGPKGIVGITVAEQSVEVYFDKFDDDIYLPGGTIIAPLAGVYYLDSAEARTLLDSATYALQRDGRLALVSGASWPTVSTTGHGVMAEYDLGITDPADPRIELMKTAIIMHVKMTLDMETPETYKRTIDALVGPLRAMNV